MTITQQNTTNKGGNTMTNTQPNPSNWVLNPAVEAHRQIVTMLRFGVNPLSKEHASYFVTGNSPHYVNQLILPPGILLTFDEVGHRGGRVKQGAKGFKLLRKRTEVHPITGEEITTWSYRVYFTLGQTSLTQADIKGVKPISKQGPKLVSDNALGKVLLKLRSTKATEKSLEVAKQLINKATPEELWEALQSIKPVKPKATTTTTADTPQPEAMEVI